jgi:hypothetical protein
MFHKSTRFTGLEGGGTSTPLGPAESIVFDNPVSNVEKTAGPLCE